MEKWSQFVKRYSLFFILGFGFLALVPYIVKNLTFTTTGGIIYRGFVSALILVFAIFYFYKNTKSFNLKLIVPISIYIVCGIVATFVTPSIVHANVSWKIYLESLITIGLNALSIFLFLDHLSSKNEEYENNNLVCWIVVWFAIFLTISTYVFQFKEIGKSFTETDGWNYSVTSIFYIKTTYGYMLFVGSIFAIIIMFNKNTIFYLFIPFYFAINAFISRNKTSLIFIILLIISSFILYTIKNRRQKQKEILITVSVVGGFVAILSLLTFVEPIRFGIFNNIYYFVKTSIFENAKTVMLDRLDKWGAVFQNMKPFGYTLGYGEKLSMLIFNAYGTPLSDSTYVVAIGTGGIIKLILLLLLIFYIFKIYFRSDFSIYKKTLITIVITCVLLAGFFEDDYIYGFNFTSLFAMPFIFASNKIINNF